MHDALIILYQSVNINHKMLMKNKFTTTHMSDIDIVAIYLMNITELRDQLVVFGEKIRSEDVVPIALSGFSSSWDCLFGVFVLVRSFPTLRSFGMILSRRKPS